MDASSWARKIARFANPYTTSVAPTTESDSCDYLNQKEKKNKQTKATTQNRNNGNGTK